MVRCRYKTELESVNEWLNNNESETVCDKWEREVITLRKKNTKRDMESFVYKSNARSTTS